MVQPCNRILFGSKKEWTADTHKNVDQSQKRAGKNGTQKSIFDYSIYIEMQNEISSPIVIARRSVLAWGQELRELTFKGHKRAFWSDKNVLYFDCDDDYMSKYICQNLSVYLNLLHFISCSLYINQPDLKICKGREQTLYARDCLEKTTPSSFLGTPIEKQTLPSAHKLVHTYRLLATFEKKNLRKNFGFLIIKQVYLCAQTFGNLLYI